MQILLNKLQAAFPTLKFAAGKQFYWSPETGEIVYRRDADGDRAKWSLLHETGHALLGHTSYQADFELLRLEAAAWEHARQIAGGFEISIDESHIQNCLDTYRDWLYKRSLCPNCGTQCLQQGDFVHYRCHNCHTKWRVSTSRFCRAYRATKAVPQTAEPLL